jgi:hypothetical protein
MVFKRRLTAPLLVPALVVSARCAAAAALARAGNCRARRQSRATLAAERASLGALTSFKWRDWPDSIVRFRPASHYLLDNYALTAPSLGGGSRRLACGRQRQQTTQ